MFKAPKMASPKIAEHPTDSIRLPVSRAKVHPSAAHVALPRGLVDTQKAAPAPYLPGAGKV